MFRTNTGSNKEYGVTEIMKDSDSKEIVHQFADNQNCSFFDTIKLMWDQTAPLFRNEHLKNTLVICTVQFMVFVTSNG